MRRDQKWNSCQDLTQKVGGSLGVSSLKAKVMLGLFPLQKEERKKIH